LTVLLMSHLQSEGLAFKINPTLQYTPDEINSIVKVFTAKDLDQREVRELQGDYVPHTRSEAALMAAAEMFGYRGPASLDVFKTFFNEDHASLYGFYWDGEQWYANDEWGSDEELGEGDKAIFGIINEIKSDPEDALGSRYDYLTDASSEDKELRKNQALNIAGRMEAAYSNFSEREPGLRRAA
ncbi:MAG: hypothetical protein Q8P95_00045, partial [bacterium]|nr:hypothetical protein [bacterium]